MIIKNQMSNKFDEFKKKFCRFLTDLITNQKNLILVCYTSIYQINNLQIVNNLLQKYLKQFTNMFEFKSAIINNK